MAVSLVGRNSHRLGRNMDEDEINSITVEYTNFSQERFSSMDECYFNKVIFTFAFLLLPQR